MRWSVEEALAVYSSVLRHCLCPATRESESFFCQSCFTVFHACRDRLSSDHAAISFPGILLRFGVIVSQLGGWTLS